MSFQRYVSYSTCDILYQICIFLGTEVNVIRLVQGRPILQRPNFSGKKIFSCRTINKKISESNNNESKLVHYFLVKRNFVIFGAIRHKAINNATF